jgi:hypothetical protein
MIGTLLITNAAIDSSGLIAITNAPESLILPILTIDPTLVPNDSFEVWGFFTGTCAATIRIRDDSTGNGTTPTGTVILTINLTAGQGFFHATATYMPSERTLIKVTAQKGAGTGNPQIYGFAMMWSCVGV